MLGAIRKRKHAHKFAKCLNNEEGRRKYRVLRNESIKLLRTAKHDFKSNLASKLTTRNMSSKDWWKFFKACAAKDSRENIPPLKMITAKQLINLKRRQTYSTDIFTHKLY